MILPETHMREACLELSLEPPTIIATDGFRWTLGTVTDQFSRQMIKLERLLHTKTGRPIDLRLEAAEDRAKRMQRNVLNGGK